MRPLRFSHLKHIARSPAHYLHALTNPRPDTAGMRMGRLIHALVLGATEQPIAVYDGTRRGKEWEAFRSANPTADIVTRAEYEAAEPVAYAVANSTMARPYLDGLREHQLRWTDNGRECTGRLDVYASSFVADLKTTTDASPRNFIRNALRMGYHAQLAWYADAATILDGQPRDGIVIAVEVGAPHVVQVYRLTPEMMDEGRRVYRGWLETLRVCEESNGWPGYSVATMDFDRPEWMGSDEDKEDAIDDE